MATIKEIAKKVNVSPSTVSRVLNKGKGVFPISEKTRQEVFAAAKELGYMPNAAAQALRRGKNNTISVLSSSPSVFWITDETSQFYMTALKGILNASIQRGYHVNLLSGKEPSLEQGGIFADIGLTDGLFIVNRDVRKDQDALLSLQHSLKPLVYALDYPDVPEVYATAPDDLAGGKLATQKLLEKGHTCIGFVTDSYYPNILEKRQNGWAQAMVEADQNPTDLVFQASDFCPELLKEKGVTGIICANDTIGQVCHNRISEVGYKIPEEIAMVVFSHKNAGSLSEYGFAAVVEPLEKIMQTGVNMLIDLIDGNEIANPKAIHAYNFQPGKTL